MVHFQIDVTTSLVYLSGLWFPSFSPRVEIYSGHNIDKGSSVELYIHFGGT